MLPGLQIFFEMSEEAESQTRKAPGWFLLLGIAGFVLFVLNYQNAFPSSSLKFTIPREKIEKNALLLARKLGYELESKLKSTVFETDDSVLLFLQHNYGPAEADSLIKNGLPIYCWASRFCSPKRLEEFSSKSTPDGRLVAIRHKIGNDLVLPSLDEKAGLKLIDSFLKENTELLPENFKKLSSKSEKRKSRQDLSYVFEERDKDYHGARLRLDFAVSGNQISFFRRYLHLPDSWDLKYKIMRSYNNAISAFFWLAHRTMLAAAFLYFLQLLVARTVRWRFALRAAILISVLSVATVLASAPNIMHYYSTELPEFTFAIALGSAMLQIGLQSFIGNVALFAPAEKIYRALYAKGLMLEDIVSRSGIKTAEFRRAAVIGLALCGISQGWQNLYYFIGAKFGVTCPLSIEHPEVLGSWAPFLNLISIASMASLTEEIAYRVIFLLVAQCVFRSFWLANFMQAFIWSLGHTAYPQSPVWARIGELTVSGIIDGAVLKYFGVLPGFIAHYLFDSFMPMLFKANDWLLMLSGAAAILPPFAFLLLSRYWAGRDRAAPGTKLHEQQESGTCQESGRQQVETPAPARSEAEAHTEAEAEADTEQARVNENYSIELKSLSRAKAVILCIAALAACLALTFVPAPDKLSLALSRKEAKAIATAYLHKTGLYDPELKLVVERLKSNTNDESNQCIQDKLGKRKFKQIFEETSTPLVWTIRFCAEQKIKEMRVDIDACKKALIGLTLTLPDDAPGASLSEAEALKKITEFLNEYHKELGPFKLVGLKTVEREKRRDYSTKWECSRFGCSDLRLRIDCGLVGDVVSGYLPYWDLPDKWAFNYREFTIRRALAIFALVIQIIFALVAIVLWLLKVPAKNAPNIRWAAGFIACVALINMILNCLHAPVLLANYDSQTPFAASLIQLLCASASGYLPLLCMLGLVLILAKDAGKQFAPLSESGENIWKDFSGSIMTGYAAGAVAFMLLAAAVQLVSLYSNEAIVNAYDIAAAFAEGYSPAAYTIAYSLLLSLLSFPIAGGIYGFLGRFLKGKIKQTAFFAFLSFSIAGLTRQSPDILLLTALIFAALVISRYFLCSFFSKNTVALAAAAYAFMVLAVSSQFIMLCRPLLLLDCLICLASFIATPAVVYGLSGLLKNACNENSKQP